MSTERTVPPLRLTGVWKRYPGVDALKDVSFSVEAGEIHALLGENGAGKSTLMGVASGSVIPDAGTVEIGGVLVPHLRPLAAHRLGLAIVHQDPALLPDLTVLENMVLAVPKELRSTKSTSDTAWARSCSPPSRSSPLVGERCTRSASFRCCYCRGSGAV